MPSVTDVQQQQQQQSASSSSTTPPQQQSATTTATDSDPITQAVLLLEKKQRNLGKRKEKLEGYQQEAQSGKELNKDQREALAKYPEVIGQIECVKELSEQLKNIRTESTRNQKRLLRQAAEEKRQLVAQRLREYARLRYLLEHRPATLNSEESKLLDELSTVITPTEDSLTLISRSIDTVVSIYQGGPSSTTIKNLPGRNAQEVRETIEQLLQNSEPQTTPSVSAPEPVESKAPEETNNVQPVSDENTDNNNNDNNNGNNSNNNNLSEYPFQLDTRTQDVSVEQIIQNSQFLSNDLPTPSQDNVNDHDHALDQDQYLQSFTVVNSNQQASSASMDNQQEDVAAHPVDSNDQQGDGQWQQPRGNAQRGAQHSNGSGNRSFHRSRSNNYNQQYRGSRGGGGYDESYGGGYDQSYGGGYDQSYGGGGQRPYYDNNRGRGGSNPNYRGNRGSNYRGGNRGYYHNNNGDGYQKPTQYQQNNNQQQQVRSAPPSSTQHQ